MGANWIEGVKGNPLATLVDATRATLFPTPADGATQFIYEGHDITAEVRLSPPRQAVTCVEGVAGPAGPVCMRGSGSAAAPCDRRGGPSSCACADPTRLPCRLQELAGVNEGNDVMLAAIEALRNTSDAKDVLLQTLMET